MNIFGWPIINGCAEIVILMDLVANLQIDKLRSINSRIVDAYVDVVAKIHG